MSRHQRFIRVNEVTFPSLSLYYKPIGFLVSGEGFLQIFLEPDEFDGAASINPSGFNPHCSVMLPQKICPSMTPGRKHLTLPCNHWFMDLATTLFGYLFWTLNLVAPHSILMSPHNIPTQTYHNVFQLFGKKNWHCVAFFFGTKQKIHFVVISPTCAVLLVSLILWGWLHI